MYILEKFAPQKGPVVVNNVQRWSNMVDIPIIKVVVLCTARAKHQQSEWEILLAR